MSSDGFHNYSTSLFASSQGSFPNVDLEKVDNRELRNLPEPLLTLEERRSSPALQELIVASKKCEISGAWDLISVDYLQKLLLCTENDVPPIKPMISYDVAQFKCGDRHTNFHLQWRKQECRAKLLRSWLTYHAGDAGRGLFEEIKSEEDLKVLVGKFVVARWEVDGCWYRGVVQDFNNRGQASVYFLDLGNTDVQELETLRLLPIELTLTPAMSFRASLSVMPSLLDSESIKYGQSNIKFLTKMKSTVTFQCRIEETVNINSNLIPRVDKAVVFLNDTVPNVVDGKSKWISINAFVRQNLLEEMELKTFTVFSEDFPIQEELDIFKQQDLPFGIEVPPVKVPAYPLPVQITHVRNPHQLYIKLATPTDLADSSANDYMLQDFYNKTTEDQEKFKIRTQRLFVNRVYVWHDRDSGRWNRVLVRKVDVPPGFVFVSLIDIGDERLVLVQDIMEIKPEYTQWSCAAVRVHLVHVKIPGCAQIWPEKIISKFRDILDSCSEYTGLIVETASSNDANHKSGSHGVILIDTSFRRGYSLQARLACMGLVKPDGFAAGNYHIAFICHEGIPSYDRYLMIQKVREEAKDFPAVKTLDSAFSLEFESATNFASLVSPSECESKYLDIQAMFRGPHDLQPVYKWMNRDSEQDQNQSSEYWQHRQFLPADLPGRYLKCIGYHPGLKTIIPPGPFTAALGDYLGTVRISYAEGPGVLYIQMANKRKELELMMKDISTLVKDTAICDEDCVGSLVAVHAYNEDMVLDWHRGYVSSVINSICKVILIDIGSMLNVPLKNVRYLPNYFWCVPLYCRRAHLDVDPKCLRNSKWTLRLNNIFTDFVKLYAQGLYLAWKPRPLASDVAVMDYGQDVMFDSLKNEWWNGGNVRSDFPVIIQQDYDKKLLYQLLNSVGINLNYENVPDWPSAGDIQFEGIEKLFL